MMMRGASLIAPTPLVRVSIGKVVAMLVVAVVFAFLEIDAGLPEHLPLGLWLVARKFVARVILFMPGVTLRLLLLLGNNCIS